MKNSTRGQPRPVDLTELRRADGQRGRPKFVALAGHVYDVTDCPKWRTALHEGLHFPGQDLTGELADAPHGNEVFDRPCVRYVGPLSDPAKP